jgi:hypothetical protein
MLFWPRKKNPPPADIPPFVDGRPTSVIEGQKGSYLRDVLMEQVMWSAGEHFEGPRLWEDIWVALVAVGRKDAAAYIEVLLEEWPRWLDDWPGARVGIAPHLSEEWPHSDYLWKRHLFCALLISEGDHLVRSTYENWDEDSLEAGDTDDKGWLNEEGDSYDPDDYHFYEPLLPAESLAEFLQGKGASRHSDLDRSWVRIVDDDAWMSYGMEHVVSRTESYYFGIDDGWSMAEQFDVIGMINNYNYGVDKSDMSRRLTIVTESIATGRPVRLTWGGP